MRLPLPPGLAIAWAHRHLRALAEFEPARAGERLDQPNSRRGQAVAARRRHAWRPAFRRRARDSLRL
jgi:hypothetical protein